MTEKMTRARKPLYVSIGFLLAALSVSSGANAVEQTTLTIFAAGTLAVPFKEIDAIFEEKYPNVVVQPQFGGSVKMAKQITDLHQPADLIAVADYNVIPKYLFAQNGKSAYATWYAGFARNAVTFVYTDKSKFAKEINAENWYQVLARKGVEIGRSNPETDPSGYQTVQMLSLAEKYYKDPGLSDRILANAPLANTRDTETSLISALQLGQIDYLAIYRSDALQHHLKLLELPAKINLSDPAFSSFYVEGAAHTKSGILPGKPIVYAITILAASKHADLAQRFVALLLGPEGQAVMKKNGFARFDPPYAVNSDKMPVSLKAMVKPWPG
jgi:molybdate/tungstate transport system substrate-binding protein